ncbi:DUF2550 domain-containing protein [Hoyosella sp. YIM 151337]|uniref:DUF2550 domain-containing protein n=1 Tax=Hoyosella sp. YIM 151337 TaxID=2992742 RepID=UPI002235E09C|nr:DUF2550 domain-containing protein [Hoyosella sp. YIM 151337]MCW4355188.1 DUF2550 domain-containing protein [Hoyosella sp. YIM 151337]
MILLIILLVLLAAFTAVFLLRIVQIRSGGTAAVVRILPAPQSEGWRHGIIRYRDESLDFYRLSRLLPGPSVRLDRQAAEIESRRRPDGGELDLMDFGVTIVGVRENGEHYEFGFERGALTAFLAWIESRPPRRARRRKRWNS